MRTNSYIFLFFSVIFGVPLAAQENGPVTLVSERSAALPLASSFPVSADGVLRIGEGSGVDRQATVANSAVGGFVMVYTNLEGGSLDTARLRVVVSHEGVSVSGPSPLSFGRHPEDAPAFLDVDGETWLYFASASSDLRDLELWRSSLRNAQFAPAERLPGIDGLTHLGQWPRWVGLHGGIAVTFRSSASVPTWAVSQDGVRWGKTVALGTARVAYPRVVAAGETGCFFSYQRPPDGGYMATYFQISENCMEWSDAAPISWPAAPNKPDVHDAFALPRIDGGVDVYYVYPSPKGQGAKFEVGFDLYRRAIGRAGEMGSEQLLTDRKAFHPFAPSAHRLSDGRVLVTFSDIDSVGTDGVSAATLMVFIAPEDAPMTTVSE